MGVMLLLVEVLAMVYTCSASAMAISKRPLSESAGKRPLRPIMPWSSRALETSQGIEGNTVVTWYKLTSTMLLMRVSKRAVWLSDSGTMPSKRGRAMAIW